jgi:hypothetical protein
MTDLRATFKAAIDAFNSAQKKGGYNEVEQYLATDVKMKRVDDQIFVQGPREKIMEYLRKTQADKKYWPTIKIIGAVQATENEGIGNITGKGKYQDKWTDTEFIDVELDYKFIKNGQGHWLLESANATPIR